MRKKYVIETLFIMLFLVVIFPSTVSAFLEQFHYDKDVGKIENLAITVEPQTKDGSLMVQYEITWKVLNNYYAPISKVNIHTQNVFFDQMVALSDNIEKISKPSGGSRVQVEFKRPYEVGESITFKYSIRQKNVCIVNGKVCKFEFQVPNVNDIKIDNLTIRWKADDVKQSDCQYQEDGYLIWNKKDVPRGEKLGASVQYNKSTFKAIKTRKWTNRQLRSENEKAGAAICIITCILATIIGWRMSKW